MNNITLLLLFIAGAIGGGAFFAGYFLRMFAGEYADDSIIYTWRSLMFGGPGLIGACAALILLMEPEIALHQDLMDFFMILYIVYGFVAGIIFFIGIFWRILKSGEMVSTWSFHTMGIMVCGGIIIMAASAILSSVLMKAQHM